MKYLVEAQKIITIQVEVEADDFNKAIDLVEVGDYDDFTQIDVVTDVTFIAPLEAVGA